jgi:pimeloyl-ACP methyl ester carboxylesterase
LDKMPADHQLAVTERIPTGSADHGPIVVLVHGSLDRAGSFARVTRRLVDLHTVAYDRRGYHRSRRPGPSDGTPPVERRATTAGRVVGNDALDRHVEDLLAVIDDRPAMVVGHSYGGDVALGAALRPGGPGSILAVAAYEPPLPWLAAWASRGGTRTGAPLGPVDEDPGLVAERFFRRMVGDSAWDRLPEDAKEARRDDGAALDAELADIRTRQVPFDVSALAVPAVFGRGTTSLPHHRDAVSWLHDNVPGSRLVEIEGAGHGAHLTHPDAFARMVRSAVTRITGTGPARTWTPSG